MYLLHNIKDYKSGRVVRLEYGSEPYGIISSVNQQTGQCLVKFKEGPKVYKFTSLTVVL